MSDPVITGDLMVTALADAILDALEHSGLMSEIKLFIRGASPVPVPQDKSPYLECQIGEETIEETLTGGVSEHTYIGLLSIVEQVLGDADWLKTVEGDNLRVVVGSYDLIKRLIMLGQTVLLHPIYNDLVGLTAEVSITTDVAIYTFTEVVTQFVLGGQVVYGLENRTNNWDNAGSFAFSVRTERTSTVRPFTIELSHIEGADTIS